MTYTIEYWFEWILMLGAPFIAGVLIAPKVSGLVLKVRELFKK